MITPILIIIQYLLKILLIIVENVLMKMAGQIMIVMVLVIVAGEKMKITAMILAAIGSQMMNIQKGYVQLIRMHVINVMLDVTMITSVMMIVMILIAMVKVDRQNV